MQWKTITTSLGNSAYSLWNNGRKLLTLAYRNHSDRVYIESEDGEKRSFRCRNKGLLKNKLVLENEYGTDLGKLKRDGGREYIEIDNKKYYLNVLTNKKVEIMAEDTDKPLTICSLDLENAEAKNGLLMILCYYLLGHPQKLAAAV